jgi:hypothetical protein
MSKTPAQRCALAALIRIDPKRAACSDQVRALLEDEHLRLYLETWVYPLLEKAAGIPINRDVQDDADDVVGRDMHAAQVAGVVDIEPFTLDGEAWQVRVGKGPGARVLSPTWNSRGAAIAGGQVEVRRLAMRGERFKISTDLSKPEAA